MYISGSAHHLLVPGLERITECKYIWIFYLYINWIHIPLYKLHICTKKMVHNNYESLLAKRIRDTTEATRHALNGKRIAANYPLYIIFHYNSNQISSTIKI